jgi:hypothetical protein
VFQVVVAAVVLLRLLAALPLQHLVAIRVEVFVSPQHFVDVLDLSQRMEKSVVMV